jgi:hypothetical protein
MKTYYPYKATDGKHKYYIITKTGRKLYFGADGYNDYTIYYKELVRNLQTKRRKHILQDIRQMKIGLNQV